MNNLIEIQTTENNRITIPRIEYQQIKVVTTEILAQLFGCDSIHIQQNFANNKKRFTLGKHYFKLEGADLKEFIIKYQSDSDCNSILSSYKNVNKIRSLILWTQHGSALLSKIIDTDQAWSMQEKLVDFYFNFVSENNSKPTNYVVNPNLEIQLKIAELEVRKCAERLADRIIFTFPNLQENSKQQLLAHAYSTVTQSEVTYLLPLIEKKTFTATELAEKYGKSPQTMGKILNLLKLKSPEFSECRLSKSKYSDKQVEQYFYFETVLSILNQYFQK